MSGIWIETDSTTHSRVSSKACSLFIPLWVHMDRDNQITKRTILDKTCYYSDMRTLNKYWAELIAVDMVRHLDKKYWMVNPNEAYVDGASHNMLIKKWNTAQHS
jgi:hypothetical protein